jgi:hypothetical protein
MSQSQDEEIYHHLHLHTIIAQQKGHVHLCQADPLLATLYKNFAPTSHYTSMRVEKEGEGILVVQVQKETKR